jgi:AP-4 complex subunit beta-1
MAYFQNRHKGEVAEVKNQLQDALRDRDSLRRLTSLQRVISLMTMGVDVSSLFSEMVMATFTEDVVQKKLTYLYMTQHAKNDPDLAIMTINTLQKDCRDRSPVIRGLAIRTMSSLRLPTTIEYLRPIIDEGLRDTSSYVRRISVVACAKLYRTSTVSGKDDRFIHRLTELLRDHDPSVAANAIMALDEILEDDGGLQLDRVTFLHFVGNLSFFSEWHQSVILERIAHYEPENEEEVFDIMVCSSLPSVFLCNIQPTYSLLIHSCMTLIESELVGSPFE